MFFNETPIFGLPVSLSYIYLIFSNIKVIQYHFLFRGATSSIVELPKGRGLAMAEEHGSDNAFVLETQVDTVDYIDISSDVDTVPEMQMDLDSDNLTKPSDRY